MSTASGRAASSSCSGSGVAATLTTNSLSTVTSTPDWVVVVMGCSGTVTTPVMSTMDSHEMRDAKVTMSLGTFSLFATTHCTE